MLITIDALRAAGATQAKAEEILDSMKLAAALYGVDTPLRIIHLLAQAGHESGGFRHVREIWGPTAAQRRYEGRKDLGNVQPGDGQRYCGRSYIQTTGRANYAALRDRLRQRLDEVPDFEESPELLEQTPWSVLALFDYWDMRRINEAADRDDVEACTRLVNGGLNGIDDRRRRLAAVRSVLMPPTVESSAVTASADEFDPAAEVVLPTDSLTAAFAAQETIMPLSAFLPFALQALVPLIPKLGEMFGSGSEVSQRNLKAAELVVTAAKDAIGARNEQELVEALQSDPKAQEMVKSAVQAVWYEVVEAGGGGIAGARAANEKYTTPGAPSFAANPAFWISAALLAMPFMLLVDLFYVHPTSYEENLRTQIVTAILVIIGMVGAYWLGTSASSAKKDAALFGPKT